MLFKNLFFSCLLHLCRCSIHERSNEKRDTLDNQHEIKKISWYKEQRSKHVYAKKKKAATVRFEIEHWHKNEITLCQDWIDRHGHAEIAVFRLSSRIFAENQMELTCWCSQIYFYLNWHDLPVRVLGVGVAFCYSSLHSACNGIKSEINSTVWR